MVKFRHHSSFSKEKSIQLYLLSHVCFACRKSFKKPKSDDGRKCPECGNEIVALSRKFKAPMKTEVHQWKVVEYVVAAGFHYQTIYSEDGKPVKYPMTIQEADYFIDTYKDKLH